MNADHRPPPADDGAGDRAGADPVVVERLRSVLVAHVDQASATDETWAGIEREAADRRSARTRRRRIAVATLSLAAIIAVVLVVRIEAGRDEGARVTTEPDAIQDPTEGAAPDSWVRLLAHLPADAASAPWVDLVDLRRARQAAGVEPLPAGASKEAWQAHAQAIAGNPQLLSTALGMVPSPAELRAELGIGHEQFDQVAVVQGGPGLARYVAIGRFDPDAIAAAVAADPQWSPMLEEREHRGITYYRWGDDLRLYRKSPARDLGNGGRLVVGDGWVSWTSTDADAEATIDAWLDPARSLAADEPVRTAFEAGERRGLIEVGVGPLEDARSGGGSVPDRLLDLPAIARPRSMLRGVGADPSAVEQFGIGYATAEEAAANLDGYRRSWELFAVDAGVEVEQDGPILLATVELPPPVDGVAAWVSDGTTRRFAPSYLLYFNLGP